MFTFSFFLTGCCTVKINWKVEKCKNENYYMKRIFKKLCLGELVVQRQNKHFKQDKIFLSIKKWDNFKKRCHYAIALMAWCIINVGLPWWLSGQEPACQCRRRRFDPWVGKLPWRWKWQSSLVFLPGISHGQRSLVGYSSWGHKRVGHDLATKQ